jgi:hypothetical protein
MREPGAQLLELLLDAGGKVAIPDNTNQLMNPLIVGAWDTGGSTHSIAAKSFYARNIARLSAQLGSWL